MRIISQNGGVDMSYDTALLWVREKNGFEIVGNMPFGELVVFGEYSSSEKACKAMEMLRNANTEISSYSADSLGIKSSLRSRRYFQFPKDEDVEA